MQKYHLYRIDWVDAQSDSHWIPIDKIDITPYAVASVGWLVAERKGHVILAQNMSSNNNCADRIQIPTGWIVKRTRLPKHMIGFK